MTTLTRLLLAVLLTLLVPGSQAVERVIHYHNDALGSPIFATNQRGEVVWRRSYTPYGQELNRDAPSEPGYTGKFEEPDLGIIDVGARWYDPRIGRFLAIDPVGFSQGNPQSFNRYAYANNNPYGFVDPDGRAAETVVDVISFGLSLNAFRSDPSFGNGLGLAYDALATAVPFLPAGFGILKNAGNAADALGDLTRAARAAKGLPNKADDLLKQGYKDVSRPDAAKAGHRTFENPTSGDKLRFDQGKPGQPGYEGQDHYHRYNPNATGKQDMYIDKNGDPCARGCDTSHLFPGD